MAKIFIISATGPYHYHDSHVALTLADENRAKAIAERWNEEEKAALEEAKALAKNYKRTWFDVTDETVDESSDVTSVPKRPKYSWD